jgi:hypothetical protein
MAAVTGGRTLYGHALGVLMLDTIFPRFPGDVGNALTWPFPVRYRIVKEATSDRIMGRSVDPTLLEPFIEAARKLESDGVRAITTSCGFLAFFQRELAAAVSVPVMTSALLQVPIVSGLLRPDQRVGILTERPNLTEEHFAGVGWSEKEIAVQVGTLPPDALFPKIFIDAAVDGGTAADFEVCKQEVVDAALELTGDCPDVGALVMECTNFVPYAQAIRRATGLPVFDLYTMVTQVYAATTGHDFDPPS